MRKEYWLLVIGTIAITTAVILSSTADSGEVSIEGLVFALIWSCFAAATIIIMRRLEQYNISYDNNWYESWRETLKSTRLRLLWFIMWFLFGIITPAGLLFSLTERNQMIRGA